MKYYKIKAYLLQYMIYMKSIYEYKNSSCHTMIALTYLTTTQTVEWQRKTCANDLVFEFFLLNKTPTTLSQYNGRYVCDRITPKLVYLQPIMIHRWIRLIAVSDNRLKQKNGSKVRHQLPNDIHRRWMGLLLVRMYCASLRNLGAHSISILYWVLY